MVPRTIANVSELGPPEGVGVAGFVLEEVRVPPLDVVERMGGPGASLGVDGIVSEDEEECLRFEDQFM